MTTTNKGVNESYRSQLRKFLARTFSIDEIRTLCSDLGIEYEELSADSKTATILSLISYLGRRGNLAQLFLFLLENRPSFAKEIRSIQELFDRSSNELGGDDTGISKRQLDTLGRSMQALGELAAVPIIRDWLLSFSKDFARAKEEIELIAYYKKLHDDLQEVELAYYMLANKRFDRFDFANEREWEDLEIEGYALEDAVESLLTAIKSHAGEQQKHARWLPLLHMAIESIYSAVEERSLAHFDSGMGRLFRAFNKGLPHVNSRLVDSAQDLPVHSLAKALVKIHSRLEAKAAIDFTTSENLLSSIDTVTELADKLARLINYHNKWQLLDDELRAITIIGLDEDIAILEETWLLVLNVRQELYGERKERWAKRLQRLEQSLQHSLDDSSDDIKERFVTYRQRASKRFRKVDFELLELSQHISNIRSPLDLLFGKL